MSAPVGDPQAYNDWLRARETAAGGPDTMVHTLVANLNRQARIIHWLVVCVALAVVLTVSLAIVGWFVLRNTSTIGQNTDANTISCQAQNDFRVADHQLWDHILALSDGPFNPAQALAVQGVLDSTFALRICP